MTSKTQNDAQKRKKLIFAAKWPKIYEFQKPFMRFVGPTCVLRMSVVENVNLTEIFVLHFVRNFVWI
jgi:hypothetical protein